MTNKREWSIKYHLLILVTLFTVLIIGGASAVSAADNSANPAVTAIEYFPAKTDLTLSQSYDLVDGYWDMEESDLHPATTLEVYDEDVDDETCLPGDPSDGIHAGDILIVHYDNGESRTFTANTYFDWGGGGSMEYKHVIAWFDSNHTPCDIQVEYSYDNYPPKYKNLLKVPGKYNTKVTVSYAGQQAEYDMKITVLGKRDNPVKVTPKTIKVKASQLKKHSKLIKRKQAMTVKNAKGTLRFRKLSGNKKITIKRNTGEIKIARNLKKGTYKLKVRITCNGNSKYKSAKKTVTIKVKVR